MPLVTVLMPVYNGEAHIRESIDSILHQTWKDFELLIINDGSVDATDTIINTYKDKRIVYLSHHQNRGLVTILNEGLALAKGEYVARMDHDDIALPLRLEKQVDFLQKHPEIDLVGSNFLNISLNACSELPTENDAIQIYQLERPAFSHPSVMLRKSSLSKHRLQYNKESLHAEDYRLWIDMSLKGLKLANLKDVLINYRIHNEQISSKYNLDQEKISNDLKWYYLSNALPGISSKYKQPYLALINQSIDIASVYFQSKKVVQLILEKNKAVHHFHHPHLEQFLHSRLQNTAKALYSKRCKPGFINLLQVLKDDFFYEYNRENRPEKPIWRNLFRLYV